MLASRVAFDWGYADTGPRTPKTVSFLASRSPEDPLAGALVRGIITVSTFLLAQKWVHRPSPFIFFFEVSCLKMNPIIFYLALVRLSPFSPPSTCCLFRVLSLVRQNE